MASPSYTHDLTTYNDCTTNTDWGELVGMALSAPPDIDTDLAIHGSICITSDRAKVGLSSNVYVGAGITLAAGEAIFIWHKFFAPNSLATLVNGGVRVMIGDSLSVYDGWYVDGADTYPYGGWKNYVVDPTTTPDQTAGTTTGTYAAVGNGWNLPTAAPAKGNPFNTDIIRYGRGESIFTLGDATTPATFLGYSIVNDNPTTGRFGLVQAVSGGYLYKGLMSLGTTATAVWVDDANLAINIDNTLSVTESFNIININNIASYVNLDSIVFNSLGTVSPGFFNVVDDCSVNLTSCTFNNMGWFKLQSNTTSTGSNFIQCTSINQGNSIFEGCNFIDASGGITIYADNLNLVNNCSFESNGSNHAFYFGPDASGDTYSMVGNTYVDYAATDGATGNEVIKNNSGGLIVVNYSGGDKPTVYDVGDSSTTIASSVTLSITVTDANQDPVVGAYAYIDDPGNTAPFIMNTTTNAQGVATTGWSGGPVSGAYWRVRKYGYKPFKGISDIGTVDKEIPVTLVIDPQQQ